MTDIQKERMKMKISTDLLIDGIDECM